MTRRHRFVFAAALSTEDCTRHIASALLLLAGAAYLAHMLRSAQIEEPHRSVSPTRRRTA